MADIVADRRGAAARGRMPSTIQHFCIEGLYGYRTISLTSKFAATVLIAKNGSGKTTLLGALNAFLKCQFSRLRDLEFSSIHLSILGHSKELVILRDDIDAFLLLSQYKGLILESRRLDCEVGSLFKFLVDDYDHFDERMSHWSEDKFLTKLFL